jgi:pimeloyl-ACP methyl ester carboxylesterase
VDHYVVYLPGIGEISGEGLDEKEKSFLAGLAAHLPDLEIVKDVFPYAMNNNGLTSQRLFAALWRWIQQRKLNGKVLLANLINIRNLFQVAVSADRRYGPIYNYGTAEVIQAALLRRGYKIGHGKPVTLIGYSGGGQIAIGAATYLKTMLKAPLQVISLGGTFADDPGLVYIDHLYHLYGQKDIAQQLATLLYAGRWPLLRYSTWNQAKAEGRVTMICIGPMRHRGSGGYLDDRSYLPTGQSYQDHSVEIMARLISSSTGPLLRTTDKNEDNQ